MNAPGQTLTCNPEIEWSELLSVSFPRLFAPLLFLWCVRLIVKNGKSRKEKEKKEGEKYKPTLNWQDSNSRLSASRHELLVYFGCILQNQHMTSSYRSDGFQLNNLMTCATQLYHVVYRYNKCSLSNYYTLVHPKNALENCITTVSQVCHSINHWRQ